MRIGHAAYDAHAGRDLLEQLNRTRQRTHRILRIERLLKTHGGIGAQLVAHCCQAQVGCLEISGFENDARRGV